MPPVKQNLFHPCSMPDLKWRFIVVYFFWKGSKPLHCVSSVFVVMTKCPSRVVMQEEL